MADGDRAALAHQQQRHRHADDVRRADHAGLEPAQRGRAPVRHGAHRLDQLQAALGRARAEERLVPLERDAADVGRREAVDVLVRRDRVRDLGRVQVRRQRQLHDDAVHRVVAVELADERQDFSLARFCGELARRRVDPAVGRRLRLALDVRKARRVRADEHHDQPRWRRGCALGGGGGGDCVDPALDGREHLARELGAVDQLGARW